MLPKPTAPWPLLPPELAPHAEQIFGLIDSVFSESQLPDVGDDRKPKTNPLNANFEKKEFKELWNRINRKAVYRVEFDSNELIRNSIRALDKELRVTPLQYTIQSGIQGDQITDRQLKAGQGFQARETAVGRRITPRFIRWSHTTFWASLQRTRS